MPDATIKHDTPILGLYDNKFDDFHPIKLLGARGKFLAYLPADWITAPDPRERDKLIARGLTLYNYVDAYIDPQKLVNPQGVEVIASVVAIAAGGIIVVNLWDIFGEKWKENTEYDAINLKLEEDIEDNFDEDDIASDAGEATSVSSAAETDSTLEKLKPELVAKALSNKNAAIWFVWRHIFFCTLLAIERDHGPIEREFGEEFDLLFDEYKEKVFSPAFHRATYLYGEILARDYLEANPPALWSIEHLANFLDFELIKEAAPCGTVSINKERADKVVKKILSASDSAPKLSWADKDGKRIFQFTIEVTDQSQINLVDLVERANNCGELRGGPFHTKIEANEDELKMYPGAYNEIKKELRNLGYDFERCIKKNKNWREVLKASYPILKEHSDLLEILPVIRPGRLESVNEETVAIAVEKGFSYPSDIAAEITARREFSKYKPFDVTPRTLKDDYASGKYIRVQNKNEPV